MLHSYQYGMVFHFDFARYSYKVMAEFITEMLEIDYSTWFLIIVLDCIFIAVRNLSGAHCEWKYVYDKGEVCDSPVG